MRNVPFSKKKHCGTQLFITGILIVFILLFYCGESNVHRSMLAAGMKQAIQLLVFASVCYNIYPCIMDNNLTKYIYPDLLWYTFR